jgi:UDPglucose 6-dehydrogenase
MIDRVSVIGLGKLGACMAAIMASKGKQVMGVDVNQNNVDMINQGQSPVVEPGLAELIASNTHRLRATTDFRTAVLKTDASFLIVPKPSDKQSSFSLKYLTQAIQEIGRILSEKSELSFSGRDKYGPSRFYAIWNCSCLGGGVGQEMRYELRSLL